MTVGQGGKVTENPKSEANFRNDLTQCHTQSRRMGNGEGTLALLERVALR